MTDSPQTNTGTFYASNAAGSAGGILRAAREKAGMRLDEMALKTKIPLHVLEAIEHDDTAKLGQPVYVRGYLRKYATALGVPESQVLTSFDARAMKPPREQSRLAEEQVDEPAQGSRAILWVLVVVILAAIAGAAVLYIRGWGPSAVHRKAAAPRVQQQVVTPPPAPVSPAPTPATDAAPQPESAAPVEPQSNVPAEPQSNAPAAPANTQPQSDSAPAPDAQPQAQ